MKSFTIKTLTDGKTWVLAHSGLWQAPGLVLLSGPMGAGKTQMASWILESLGSTEAASPTYSIHHHYTVATGSVDHFDLYRLENDVDLESSGFWDILAEKNNLVLVEWADRLPPEAYPKDRPKIRIQIERLGDQRIFYVES